MAYQKLTYGFPTNLSWHSHLIPSIRTFLEANGWTINVYNITSSTDWQLIVTKGSVAINFKYYGSQEVTLSCGTSWDGATGITGSSNNNIADARWNYYYSKFYRNPETIYLITQGSTFTMVVLPLPGTSSTYDGGTWISLGMMQKFGTFSGGRFVLKPDTYGSPENSMDRNYVQIGDIGAFGVPPEMWNYGSNANWDVSITTAYQVQNTVGRTNCSSLATPMLPLYFRVRDDTVDLWRCAGYHPNILQCWSKQVHKVGDVITHLGKQWLMFGDKYQTGYSIDDTISNLFQLDD